MTNPREVRTFGGKNVLVCRDCGVSYEEHGAAADCCAPGRITIPSGELSLSELASPQGPGAAEAYPPAEGPAVKAPELLGKAAALMHERGKTYDEPEGERSMGKTVAAFNAITGRDLTESEGWLLMCVLKSVRAATRKEPHRDSLEDLIAYAALMAEARLAGR